MKLLRRLLKVQAAPVGSSGAWRSASLPPWVLEDLLGQPALADYVWVRAAAVMGVVLALLMVLVAQRIDDLWWWSWAFAVAGGRHRDRLRVNARVRPARRRRGVAFWWTLAVVNGAFGAGLLIGMGLGGQEKPIV